MKERLLLLLIVVVILICFIGCGNRDVFDTKYSFTNAYIKIGDDWIDVEIKKWQDYDGEQVPLTQIQLTLKDDTILLISSYNCILYKGELPKK